MLIHFFFAMEIKKLLATASLAGSVLLAPALGLAAGPAAPSSCMGQEAAAISPPGSTEEFPGGMAELKPFSDTLGLSVGELVTVVAKLHSGSHEACDADIAEALGE